MNKQTNSNINLSSNYGKSLLRKHRNKGINDMSVKNVIQRYKKIELENQKSVSSKKANTKIQTLIVSSDMIIHFDKIQLNLLNKNQFNSNFSKSENLNNFNNLNNQITKPILNESNSILMNEQQYIRLLSPFNSKLASETNCIYTFTNRPYKQINKNLNNIYTISKSAFLNMSSIISKLFKKSVKLELIRIYSPQNESNILANLIGILSNFIKFRYLHMKLFKVSKTKNLNKGFSQRFSNNKIPSFLSGIYLKLAGRVLTQKLQRRVNSKIAQKCSLARTNASLINTNRFVNKNKRGTFSITIKTGHIIND